VGVSIPLFCVRKESDTMKVFLATKNKGKIKDFEKLTEGMDLEVVTILDGLDIPDVVEDGETFEENSRKKGENATDSEKNQKMLELLKDVKKENRKAHFVSVVSIAFPNGEIHSFRGEIKGEILFEARGNNGFGYNPIFYSYELGKSFGEADDEERKSVSHRARAFRKLIASGLLEEK